MGFGMSLMTVLQLCRLPTWSFNQRLYKNKPCKPACTLAPRPCICNPLLIADLSKMKAAPLRWS